MDIKMISINNIIKKLSITRPVFHSEADFQHALAWEIHKENPDAQIRLEVPSGRIDKRERIDVLIREGKRTYAIELKYKKTGLSFESNGETYNLRPDLAQDVSRYDFIKDVVRLERFVASNPNITGYAIMLTNDSLYWKESLRGVNSEAFFLHEGRALRKGMEMKWREGTGQGTSKGREQSHKLLHTYKVHWESYSSIPKLAKNNEFRYLLLRVVR